MWPDLRHPCSYWRPPLHPWPTSRSSPRTKPALSSSRSCRRPEVDGWDERPADSQVRIADIEVDAVD